MPGQETGPRVAIKPRPASGPREGTRVAANLRLDVKVVLVPVTVTDPYERPITTLPKGSFRLLEDGVEQPITYFSQEETPVSVGLLVDTSGSMKHRIDQSVAALDEFFKTTNSADEFFLVRFSNEAERLTGFTSDPQEIYRKLGLIEPRGWTAMLDGIGLGIHQMKFAHNPRKALLILSDGGDNNSRYSQSEVRRMAVEGDVRIFAIGLFQRARALEQLAEQTGGRLLEARNLNELPDLVQKLSRDIRSQNLLGYSPSHALNDGKYHRLKVELLQPPGGPILRATWRQGYYAPQE